MGKEHMRQPLRILQVVDKLTPDSGVAGVVMRYHDAIDKKQIVFDFLVHEEPDLRIRRRLEKDGSKIFVAPPLRLAALALYLRFLRRFYGEHPEYAIVHGHLPNAAPFYLGMARAIGVPVRIVHCHNTRSGDTAPKRIRNSLLFKLIPLCANVRCACSEAAARFLFGARNGRVKRPYHLVRNALPLGPYRFRPEVRERTRHMAEDAQEKLKAIASEEIVGELIDLEIGVSGISMMTVDQEMVLQRTGVCRGQYMFAQANSLALAVIDAPAALTGVANVKYKIPVSVGAVLVARAEVVRKLEDKYTIWVKIRNNHREVFRAKFLIVAIPEQRSQVDENRS